MLLFFQTFNIILFGLLTFILYKGYLGYKEEFEGSLVMPLPFKLPDCFYLFVSMVNVTIMYTICGFLAAGVGWLTSLFVR